MKKIIALSLATLMIGSGAALAAQPFNPTMYGAKQTTADQEIARISAPGTVFTTQVNGRSGWTASKTYKVQPDGTAKLIDLGYINNN
tara:strand:- start:404 stop:664 length:261 start_codon:yes stop_codon:yes gene_type:complete